MFRRPFTAICQKYGETTAVPVDIPDGKDKALEAAKELLPDQNIIALIPGQHAPNVYTYDTHPSQSTTSKADTTGPWPDNCVPGF